MRRSVLVLALTWASSAGATPTDGVVDPCTPAPVAGAENELFKDIPPGSVGHAEAKALYDAGVTLGCQASPLLFCASCEISRAAFFTFVVRAAKVPLDNPAQPTFSDVPQSHPFYKEIETAAAQGFTTGCSAGKFCPDAPIPRSSAAIVIAKAAGLSPVTPATPTFSDVPSSHPAFGAVEALSAACVTNGCSAGQFCPANETTRIQAAVLIARAFDLGGTNPCPEDAGADAPGGGGAPSGGGSAGAGAGWNDSGVSPAGGAGGKTGNPGSTEEGEDSGCGCTVPRARHGTALAAGLAFFLALAARRRRR